MKKPSKRLSAVSKHALKLHIMMAAISRNSLLTLATVISIQVMKCSVGSATENPSACPVTGRHARGFSRIHNTYLMKIDNDVLAVLSAANIDGAKLFLTGRLDRALYTLTNKVLEAAGGKWNRKAGAHVFDGDASERVEQIILTGDVLVPKEDFEFFPTPPAVVARVMELAGVERGMRVLEPSAGLGAIAYPCAAAGAAVDCYEIQQGNAYALAMKAPHDLGKTKTADFLTVEPEAVYDRVVMNPPFSRQADIKHVLHALKFLKPNGRLVSVMGAGVTFRQDKLATEFRQLVVDRGGRIETLPQGSFQAIGTKVNTVIVEIPS